eukprot:scaffold35605_cov31-Tisochrysis_lutea.AAC.3
MSNGGPGKGGGDITQLGIWALRPCTCTPAPSRWPRDTLHAGAGEGADEDVHTGPAKPLAEPGGAIERERAMKFTIGRIKNQDQENTPGNTEGSESRNVLAERRRLRCSSRGYNR